MYQLADFRKGLKVLVDNEPYEVIEFQHVKPGKGNQFTRCKLRNLITGQLLERTYKSGEKFGVPDVMNKDMSFLYSDDTGFHFMDQNDYSQVSIAAEDVSDAANYLTENLKVSILFYNERAIGVEVPNAVNLKVTQTDPGFKGNTVTGATKPATLESGYVVQVPLHINEGDVLRINTKDGTYVERVSIG